MKARTKARFVFEVEIDIEDTRGYDPKEIIMKQVTGQINMAHHGAFDLDFRNGCVEIHYPEEVTILEEKNDA